MVVDDNGVTDTVEIVLILVEVLERHIHFANRSTIDIEDVSKLRSRNRRFLELHVVVSSDHEVLARATNFKCSSTRTISLSFVDLRRSNGNRHTAVNQFGIGNHVNARIRALALLELNVRAGGAKAIAIINSDNIEFISSALQALVSILIALDFIHRRCRSDKLKSRNEEREFSLAVTAHNRDFSLFDSFRHTVKRNRNVNRIDTRSTRGTLCGRINAVQDTILHFIEKNILICGFQRILIT